MSAAIAADSSAEEPGGLAALVTSARLQQQLADQSLVRLQAHAAGLDAVVREELHRSFIAACGGLVQEARDATEALAVLKRTAGRRLAWTGVLTAALWSGVALLVLARLLPSSEELSALRAQRQQLLLSVRQLSDSGGRVQLRRCGSAQRLCVRVDRQAPAYGAAGDYLVVRGY